MTKPSQTFFPKFRSNLKEERFHTTNTGIWMVLRKIEKASVKYWCYFGAEKRSKIRELWGGSYWFAYSKTSLHLNTNLTYEDGGGILGPIASMVFPPCETLISGRKMSHKKWSLFYVFIPSQRRRAARMQANVRVFKVQLKIVSVNYL